MGQQVCTLRNLESEDISKFVLVPQPIVFRFADWSVVFFEALR